MLSHYGPPTVVFLALQQRESAPGMTRMMGRPWPGIGFIVVQADSCRKYGGAEARLARQKESCSECIFFLHAGVTLVFCECELALPQRRERVSLRRTRVKIEFYIASRPATFPRDPNSKEKSRQTYALAVCGRHLLHGVWRHVWDGRDHSRRGLRPWDFDFAVPAGAMVPTDSVHDRRALQRAAAGGWLLRVGAARFG